MKSIVLASLLVVSSMPVISVASTEQVITAECTTAATGMDGIGKRCSSGVSILMAPDNHVFATGTVSGGVKSGAGRDNECIVGWEDYIDVIPGSGILQPRKMTLQAKALGPKGPFSGRGWTKCEYKVNISKYK